MLRVVTKAIKFHACLVGALAGCASPPPPPEPVPAPAPAAPAPSPAVEAARPPARATEPSDTSSAAPIVTKAADDPLGRMAAATVDRQIAAYNAHDLEAFLATYADSIAVQNLGDTVTVEGKAALRRSSEEWFRRAPQVRNEVLNRIVMGPFVVDHERLTGAPDGAPLEVVGIFEVRVSLIRRVWFIPPPPRVE